MENIANFLYEIGTLRKTARAHRQLLLTDDLTDNIASHSYRVSVIGLFLAHIEKANIAEVVMMCLTHDWPETRSNDHNRVHKRYIRINTDGVINDQAALYFFDELAKIIKKYEERTTREAIIAKDADNLDQILLLKEYELQGNKEATRWLEGVRKRPYARVDELVLNSSKELGKKLYDTNPSDWWKDLYTSVNLSFEEK